MTKLKMLKGKWYLVAALVLGLAFLLIGGWQSGSSTPPTVDTEEDAATVRAAEAALEERLCDMLRQMAGVGEVKVMVTLDASRLRRYVSDHNGASGESHVIIKTENGETLIAEQELYPAVRGVAVICGGGGDDAVRQQVTELISALFDLGSHHISVAPAR